MPSSCFTGLRSRIDGSFKEVGAEQVRRRFNLNLIQASLPPKTTHAAADRACPRTTLPDTAAGTPLTCRANKPGCLSLPVVFASAVRHCDGAVTCSALASRQCVSLEDSAAC